MPRLSLIGSERVWSKRHLLLYCLPLFFIALAETGMAYIFPLIVVNSGVSNTLFGIMLGASALMGIAVDLALPSLRQLRGWKAQLLVACGLALLFPLLTFGGMATKIFLMFFAASIVWYVFYELLMMSEQSFVIRDHDSKGNAKDWGEIYFAYYLASIIGPILAQSLDAISATTALISMFILIAIGLAFSLLAAWLIRDHHSKDLPPSKMEPLIKKTAEFKYFRLFSSRIFPVLILSVVCLFVEQMFWHFGALLGESIHISEEFNWLIITAFSVPMLIGSIILSRFPIQNGKKRLAILAVMLGGATLGLSYFTDNLALLFTLIFITGIALSFTMPLGEAVYSDYLERAGHSELYLISLIRFTSSISYLLSPVVGGALSDWLGYKTTFAVVGVSAALIAVILLIITPKKIHLPQKELQTLELAAK